MPAEYLIPAFAENEAPANSERCTDRGTTEAAAPANAIDDPPVVIRPAVPPAAKSEIEFHPVEPSFDQFSGPQRIAITHARAGVLEILGSENACSSWLGKTDPHVLETFSSLRFWIEKDGPTHIVKQRDDRGIWVQRGPYIARTSQGTGINTSVGINANGAFFRKAAEVSKIEWQNGTEMMTSARQSLHVGPFDGGSFEAQIITMLHELAHVVGAIPHDGLSPSGLNQSQVNTELVLQHCKNVAKASAKLVRPGQPIGSVSAAARAIAYGRSVGVVPPKP